MKGLNFFSLFSAVWFLFFLELTNRWPARLFLWYTLALLLPFIFFLFIRRIIKKQSFSVHRLLLPPLFLLLGTMLLLIFLDRPFFRHLLIFFAALMLYFDFYNLVLFLKQDLRYRIGSLEQINLGIWNLVLFFFAAAFFSWLIFLAKSFWPILILMTAISFLVFWEIFLLKKIEGGKIYLYSLALALLAAEFFWAISLWSIGFLSRGLIFSLFLIYLGYVCQGWLAGRLNQKRAGGYFLIILFLIIFILAAARWV